MPRFKHTLIVFWIVVPVFLLPSATDGIKSTASELVRTDGSIIRGIAIPLRIPYNLRASLDEHPDTISWAGIKTASALWKRWSQRLFNDKGRANLRVTGKDLIAGIRLLFLLFLRCLTLNNEYTPAVISPRRLAIRAASGVMVIPRF